jgi:para-aminobenzoate synthetase/4-amino-4-deoxychorismate lyase
LFDDCDATPESPRSRLYTGHAGTLVCEHSAQLPAVLSAMEDALCRGLHAVGVFDYELGAQMHGIAPRACTSPPAQILLFAQCTRLSSDEVTHWLSQRDREGQPAGIAHVCDSVSETHFEEAIRRIRAYIEAGDTYQVNYTYRLRFDVFGSPIALYRRLRERQPVPYGVLIALPDRRSVLSLSPELFAQHERGMITARPMKGTAPATGDARQDADRAAALAADSKNRAENLMIVDLLRNDLGRVAKTGSVRVPHLFQVDRYAGVLQMTSTIEAQLRKDATLADIFTALYPCGSITGAPKRRTMQIIRELEPDARGIYTGAIGWFDRPRDGHRVGDFCMSVPIRTLTLQAPDADGTRKGEMGVGAGIVHDSDPAEEYAECKLKASFLTGLMPGFELIETLQATPSGCRYLDLHLQRLRASADRFGFRFNEAALREQLEQAFAAMTGPHRLRVALAADGSCSLQSVPLVPLVEPVRLLLSEERTAASDIFLGHKTTVRGRYDRGWRAAEAQGAFDMLFFNTDGELTEGGRSNVFLRLDGRWYTPPLSSGVLPGVMRRVLLEDSAWNAQERRLTLADLYRAEEIIVCNALRGVLRATL